METILGIIIIILLVVLLTIMIYNWSSAKKECPYCGGNCGGTCVYKQPTCNKCNTCNTCNKPQTYVRPNVCNRYSSSS